jgi:hypothetical protein
MRLDGRAFNARPIIGFQSNAKQENTAWANADQLNIKEARPWRSSGAQESGKWGPRRSLSAPRQNLIAKNVSIGTVTESHEHPDAQG